MQIIHIGKNAFNANVSSHLHTYSELVYCTSGGGRFLFDDNTTIDYSVGDLVIIPPLIRHTNTSEKGVENIFLTISEFKMAEKPIILTDDSEKTVKHLLTSIFKYNTNLENRDTLMQDFLTLLLDVLPLLKPPTGEISVVSLIEEDILKNFTSPDYTSDLAFFKLKLSNEYCRKLFIKEKGISPLQFLLITRINYSKTLLLSRNSSSYNISQISELSGFDDPLYYSRVFKKIVGVSPKNYR